MKNNKGITLIALIITIIVLLILAGVSIAMLAGENNIFSRATESAAATKLSNAGEIIGIEVGREVTDYYNKHYVNSEDPDGEDSIAAAITAGITAAKTTLGDEITINETKISSDHKIGLEYGSGDDAWHSEGTLSGTVLSWSAPAKGALGWE